MKQDTFRILILIVKRVGEILVSTPVLRALRKSYPEAEITVVIDKGYEDVLLDNPNVDHLFLLDPQDSFLNLFKKAIVLRKMKFNVTIDFLANPRSALISLLLASPVRFGLNKRIRKLAYNNYIPSYPDTTPYIADIRLNVMRALNKITDGTDLDFFIDNRSIEEGKILLRENGIRENDQYVTISPVSLRNWKLWPFERYARVADYLIREKFRKVVLVCGLGEFHFLRNMMDRMQCKPSVAIEFHRLKVLGYILKTAALHIGNDGGIKHLASAVRVPTITIFGPGNANVWNESNDPQHIALWKEIECRSSRCYQDCVYEYKCLQLVDFQDVKSYLDFFCSKTIMIQ